MEDTDMSLRQSQNQGCWLLGSTGGRSITSHCIAIVLIARGYVICIRFQNTSCVSSIITRCSLPFPEPVYTGCSSVHWNATGKPLDDQCTLGYHWATQRIIAGYTGTPLENLSWNSPTLECHCRNSNICSLHWNTTGGTVTAHTRPDTYS